MHGVIEPALSHIRRWSVEHPSSGERGGVGLVTGLDRLQQRRPKVGLPIAVVYKYADDSGGYLAALITYYAFVSLFPLLLILTTALGIVLAGHPGLQQRIEASALSQFPVIGDDLGHPRRI